MRNIEYLKSIEAENSQNQLSTSPESLTTTNYTNGNISFARKRKLVLHFDQHNTIQVACTLPGRRITVEEGLNNFLTSVTWGKEVGEDRWQWVSNEPRLTKPPDEPDSITYFKYLEKKIVKSPEDRARLKQLTCRFVHEEPGKAFKEYFDLYLQSLIYPKHDDDDEGDEENDENLHYYTNGLTNGKPDIQHSKSIDNDDDDQSIVHSINGHSCKLKLPPNTIPAGDPCNKSLYHLILPEFFDMIRRLQKANRDFSIILRTMGIDSHNFLETIKPIFEGKHRLFRDIKPLKINTSVGQIKRLDDGTVTLHMDNQIFSTDAAIYDKLCSLEGISAIRDDFAYWQANDYSCYAAKPLWIDLNDMDHHHIIFDDNIRLDSTIEDCIVNIRLRRLESTDDDEFESVDFESYSVFEKSSILQPNLIKLLNPHARSDSTRNYYFELVRRSEAIYDRMLKNRDKLAIQTAFLEKETETSVDKNQNFKDQKNVETDPNPDPKELNKARRKSEDIGMLNHFSEKHRGNIKLNRSFSVHLEEVQKQTEKENEKSTICLIS